MSAARGSIAAGLSSGRSPVLRCLGSDERVRAASPLPLPDTARVLSMRVACVLASGPRPAGSLLLAVGERGRDPDVVFPADRTVAVVETQLCLDRSATGGVTVDGRYLVGRGDVPALELRWGVSSRHGHFLLVSGLHLRLPSFVVRGSGVPSRTRMPVLRATVAVCDADGVPLRGVVGADELAWQLTTREPTPARPGTRPRTVTA